MPAIDYSGIEQQYGLPAGLLAAQQQVESGGNPNAVSLQGAVGIAQLMPAIAKSLGVDPHDPVAATIAQARLNRQNLDATGGDIDRAMMMYHGGPDTRQWGPKTEAYPGKILAALTHGAPSHAPAAAPADASDPIEAALAAKAGVSAPAQNAPASSDPIEAALQARIGGGNAGGSPLGSQVNSAGSGGGGTDANPGASVLGAPNLPQGDRPLPQGTAGTAYENPPPGQSGGQGGQIAAAASQALTGAENGLAGIRSGFRNTTNALINGAGYLASGFGLAPNGVADAIHKFANADESYLNNGADTNSTSFKAGQLGGSIASTLPVTELKLINAAPGASGLASALAKITNYGTQGAAAGYLGSGGGDNALADTKAGAVIGGLGGPLAEKLVGSLAASKLGQAIGNAIRPNVMSPEAESGISQMIDGGASFDEIAKAYPQWATTGENGKAINWYVANRASGGKVPINFQATPQVTPQPLDPADVQAAMGSRGNNVGVEGSPALPQAVHAHASVLQQQGVPLDQALREARLTAIGAQPTYANVTRDPAALRAEVEGAKVDSVEGAALAAQRANNNGVVVNRMADTAAGFSPTGKVPGTGDATAAAQQALADASDTSRRGVTQAYASARAADPEALIEPTNLNAVLGSQEAHAVPASTPEGALLTQVRNSIEQGQLAHNSQVMPEGMSPDALNGISTMTNRKFGPDKSVNYWINQINGAADKDMSQIDTLGDAWRNARQAHQAWASEFQDPKGVRDLIARDPNGNFLNADKGAANDAMWTASNSKPAMQIINALKNNGADNALGMLKSHVAQQAYEAATGKAGNAVDQAGNSPVSGRAYHGFLNKVGGDRLGAIYSPEESANLTNLGHSANIINETPAGVNNASNTSSALANAILAAQTSGKQSKLSGAITHGMPAIGALLGHLTGAGLEAGGLGGLVAEPLAKSIAGAAQRRAQSAAGAALADQLARASSPAAARSAAVNDNISNAAKSLADTLAKKMASGATVITSSNRRGAN